MGLRRFERRLEELVEGAFARAFQTSVRPIELGRRLTREMDDHRTLGVDGAEVVPNHFTFVLHATDHADLDQVTETLKRQLADAAREHARDEGYRFLGPIEIDLDKDDALRAGTFRVTSRLVEGPGGAVGSLVMPNGDRVPLGDDPVTIGRLPECEVCLSDNGISRNHAQIRRDADSWVVADLGSTNGTRVGGRVVSEARLADGDEITVGSTILRFDAS